LSQTVRSKRNGQRVFVFDKARNTLTLNCPGIKELDHMVVVGTMYRKRPDMASSTKERLRRRTSARSGAIVDVQRVVRICQAFHRARPNERNQSCAADCPAKSVHFRQHRTAEPNQFAEQGSGGGLCLLSTPLLVKGLTFNAGAPPASTEARRRAYWM